jgi:nitronate monooxygenase
MLGGLGLIPQVVDAMGGTVPVVAAGGVMDGRGLAAALAMGAGGVQMGTAFLTVKESGAPSFFQAALLSYRKSALGQPSSSTNKTKGTLSDQQLLVTSTFSGKPAQGLGNRYIRELQQLEEEGMLPDYPIPNVLTQELRKASKERNSQEFVPLWAGQGVPLVTSGLTATELIDKVELDAREIFLKMAKYYH